MTTINSHVGLSETELVVNFIFVGGNCMRLFNVYALVN